MTKFGAAAAFATIRHVAKSSTQSSSFISSSKSLLVASNNAASPTSMTMMSMASKAMKLKDCTSGAISFFTGVRIPATLVAGTSLASMFTLVKLAKEMKHQTRVKKTLFTIHQYCSLLAFFLSVTAIVTSTSASTLLLLGHYDPMAYDVYHFLRKNFDFDFLLTRWSFLVSLLSFLTSVGFRTLLEFDLLEPPKRLAGSLIVLSLTGLIFHLVSYTNTTLNCWPNLICMTQDVIRMLIQRARPKHPLAVLSVTCFAGAIAVAIVNFYRTVVINSDNVDTKE